MKSSNTYRIRIPSRGGWLMVVWDSKGWVVNGDLGLKGVGLTEKAYLTYDL